MGLRRGRQGEDATRDWAGNAIWAGIRRSLEAVVVGVAHRHAVMATRPSATRRPAALLRLQKRQGCPERYQDEQQTGERTSHKPRGFYYASGSLRANLTLLLHDSSGYKADTVCCRMTSGSPTFQMGAKRLQS